MLKCAQVPDSSPDYVASLRHRLDSEGVAFGKVLKICREAKMYQLQRLDASNRHLDDATAIVDEVLSEIDLANAESLEAVLNEVTSSEEIKSLRKKSGLTPAYITGIIGARIIEQQELQDADSYVEEEDT